MRDLSVRPDPRDVFCFATPAAFDFMLLSLMSAAPFDDRPGVTIGGGPDPGGRDRSIRMV